MYDIDKNEALALLSTPQFCYDCADWTIEKSHPQTQYIVNPLVDIHDVSRRLIVDLRVSASRKTGSTSYSFNVFKLGVHGRKGRVFGLDITKTKKPIKDHHKKPHYHFGIGNRIDGDESWARWSFEETLEFFSLKTNITFKPQINENLGITLK